MHVLFYLSFPGPGAVVIMSAHLLRAEEQLDCLPYIRIQSNTQGRVRSQTSHSHVAHPNIYPVLEEKSSR